MDCVEKAVRRSNKQDVEARRLHDQKQFRKKMQRILADTAETRAYVMKLSMMASVQRAAQIAVISKSAVSRRDE